MPVICFDYVSFENHLSVTCASIDNFLIPLQNFLIRELNISKTKLQGKSNNLAKDLRYTGINALKIYNYLYKDANLFLERKRNKVIKFISELRPKNHFDLELTHNLLNCGNELL